MLVVRHEGDVEVVFFSTAQALWRNPLPGLFSLTTFIPCEIMI